MTLATFVVPPADPAQALGQWSLDPLPLAICVVAGVAYGAGLRRLRVAGHAFPRSRPAAYFAGLATLVAALASPIDVYADVLFSVHMVQHLLLAYVAPPLLALGAPVTLALAAVRPETRRRFLVPVLQSGAVSILTMPLIGWALFVIGGFAFHFTGMYEAALERPWVHAIEHGLFLGVGLLFWWPVVGLDPGPHRPSFPVRLVSLSMAMVVSGFVAVAISSADRPLYPWYAALPPPWGPDALSDQRWAAAVMWVAGSLILIVAGLFVAAAWRRHDDERQRRVERLIDRTTT